MSNKLDCGIVRDLLPSYVDGLTSKETNTAVEEHLEGCMECAEALKIMKEPERAGKSSEKQVDYLKTLRRRSAGRSLVIGIVLMLIGITLIGYRFFYIGTAANADDISCEVTVEGGTLYVTCAPTVSGIGVSRVSFSYSAGIVQMNVYTAPKTFLSKSKYETTYTPEGVEAQVMLLQGQVRFDGLIIWENGAQIESVTARLFEAANPFAGDMPANNKIADIIGISEQFGTYTNELQTDAEPYGWTLILENSIMHEDEKTARDLMRYDSYIMLAVIDNLGYVTWEYEADGEVKEYTVKTNLASNFAGMDIKECGKSASALQQLMDRVRIRSSVVSDILQEDGKFTLRFDCYLQNLYSLTVNYYLDGELIGSHTGENADGSAIKTGDSLSIDFVPEDFPEGTTAAKLTTDFSYDLIATYGEGNEIVLLENKSEAIRYAKTYFYYIIAGEDGTPEILKG